MPLYNVPNELNHTVNAQGTSNMVPAHLHVSRIAVYPALLVACYATLHPLSVRRCVGLSLFTFFVFFFAVFDLTAPAQVNN